MYNAIQFSFIFNVKPRKDKQKEISRPKHK